MAAITENADRYPTSAQCEILGVPRSTYHGLRDEGDPVEEAGPTGGAVREESGRNHGRYGARRIKRALARRGIVASRRRARRSMRSQGLRSRHQRKALGPHASRPNEAATPNVLGRGFDGHAPHTHVCSDLTYVRVGAAWCYVCLPVDLHDREIVGHAASGSKDAALAVAAFATVAFPLYDIEVFHTDRGSEFDNQRIDETPGVFGTARSLSEKGRPSGDAAGESANRSLKAEMVWGEEFADLRELRARLNEYVWRHDDERLHSTLNYMSPVEFRLAGMSL